MNVVSGSSFCANYAEWIFQADPRRRKMALGRSCFLSSLLVFSFLGICGNVATRSDEKETYSEESSIHEDTFQQCVTHESRTNADNTLAGTVLPCLGKSALMRLMDAEEKEQVTLVDGVTLVRRTDDGKLARALYEQAIDPRDYRSILEALSTFMERRSLRWDMSAIHPGLHLQMGPNLNDAGVLEFVMDSPQHGAYGDRTFSTGRFMIRQFLLPLLLGFKLKLVTLIPLLLGVLVIVAKKALLLSKIALLVSGVLGFVSFSKFQQQQQQQQKPISLGNPFVGSFNDPQILAYHSSNEQQALLDSIMDGLKGLPTYRDRERRVKDRGARNFVWEDENKERE